MALISSLLAVAIIVAALKFGGECSRILVYKVVVQTAAPFPSPGKVTQPHGLVVEIKICRVAIQRHSLFALFARYNLGIQFGTLENSLFASSQC